MAEPTPTITLPRADVEVITSAATIFSALQAMRKTVAGLGGFTLNGQPISAAQVESELATLQQAVIRTRRALGWRQ